MIRKLASGKYRLYSRKKNPNTGRRRNLGTFASRRGREARARCAVFQAALRRSCAAHEARGRNEDYGGSINEDYAASIKGAATQS